MVYSRAVRKQLSKKTSGRHGYTILLLVSEEKCPRFCFCRRPLLFFGHFLKTKRARKSVLQFVSVTKIRFICCDFRSAIVQYCAKVLNRHLFFPLYFLSKESDSLFKVFLAKSSPGFLCLTIFRQRTCFSFFLFVEHKKGTDLKQWTSVVSTNNGQFCKELFLNCIFKAAFHKTS